VTDVTVSVSQLRSENTQCRGNVESHQYNSSDGTRVTCKLTNGIVGNKQISKIQRRHTHTHRERKQNKQTYIQRQYSRHTLDQVLLLLLQQSLLSSSSSMSSTRVPTF